MTTRIVCLSDTHGHHDQLDVPGGDLLLHTGDFSMRGEKSEIESFNHFLGSLPHPHKVVIAGNHDWMFERDPKAAQSLLTNATYLQDAEVTVCDLRIWGAPWQPWFHDWAFNLERGPQLAAKWQMIPGGIDILMTHGPPFGVLDRVRRGGHSVGCEELALAVQKKKPKLHVFGHIHEERGVLHQGETLAVNACNCTFWYEPKLEPIVIDWGPEGPEVVS